MYPADFRDTAEDVWITLLAALCSSRQAEITDALGDLLIALVQKINARAERRVERQLTAELKKVRGKEGILFRLADAAIRKPDEIVRTALYPVVGEKTLRDLVAEAKANQKVFKAKVRTTLRSSYSNYFRQMLPPLRTLGFRCNNTAYRPVMDALALLEKYADVDGKMRFYDAGDVVPMDGVVRKDWREAVVDDKGKVKQIPYECASWSHCGTRSAAARSTSRAACAGATRRTTCPATSRPPAPCTTRRSASPRTPRRSSPTSSGG
ncbi:hypothetical protein [Streptomyces roseochromogenus]|uniref:Tn3 transposase DDE domain-containing protein n=1 Tax=Streptomyces roseochromogenus subsp. oscitans DS 12.976 TaxID=1352936 RepID=V6KX71_STRRC|nr:hypothetical protein [Streptomyces roseochromogenus]EST36750.1 hypothetical protein M878_00475 [Streptomyces roseochromogenus subsp. oscitans DS 12.976]